MSKPVIKIKSFKDPLNLVDIEYNDVGVYIWRQLINLKGHYKGVRLWFVPYSEVEFIYDEEETD